MAIETEAVTVSRERYYKSLFNRMDPANICDVIGALETIVRSIGISIPKIVAFHEPFMVCAVGGTVRAETCGTRRKDVDLIIATATPVSGNDKNELAYCIFKYCKKSGNKFSFHLDDDLWNWPVRITPINGGSPIDLFIGELYKGPYCILYPDARPLQFPIDKQLN